MRIFLQILAFVLCASTWQTAIAQEVQQSQSIRSPVVVIDMNRVLRETQYGQRLEQDMADAFGLLEIENRAVEDELAQKEREIRDQRSVVPAEDFRKLAAEFDNQVGRIREERIARNREIVEMRNSEQDALVRAAAPVIAEIAAQFGAAIVLDRRNVFLTMTDAIDITDLAISAMDTKLGDGVAPSE